MANNEGDRGIEVHLLPSVLGTKDYWDQAYTLETNNFLSNPSDEGIIWFEESDAENRVLSYLSSQLLPPDAAILDIGMGNGHLLFELLENQDEGFPAGIGALVGIDYSPASVRLSAKIAHERGVQERVKFDVVDVLENTWTGIPGGFDIVVDKGTFDAICLSAELRADGRRPEECYPECVARLMKSGALLVVTSCNWTEEELVKKITACCELELFGRIEYPSFTFGGKKGQTVCSVCFHKVPTV